jgi:hypothetical protein
MNKLSNEFLSWIQPLIYSNELEILTQHTQVGKDQEYKIKDKLGAMRKFKISNYKLYAILWRLEFLATTYELEFNAGLLS